ncbi:DNA starvation/stationary phase protection protein [Microlunatus endophyticus]|uniref:DNA starvation/stationary phase protection protein n=1 Tax=Microlunatus endophyticus TaxID=1716077 RepID=A0A917S0N7_9ACTN|nr:DNA starvation/stationary phase protection protein [Microlunatus endophyticus]GGL47236.1 DNA starvation/stationary phase protection protein [Microlunatus endophyticus]
MADQTDVFRASTKFAEHLEHLLAELIDLHLVGKQAHWNIVGPNFRDLHLQLDEIVDAARNFADDIAERLRAVYVAPDGRAQTIAKLSGLKPFAEGEISTTDAVDAIAAALYAVARTAREIHDDIDEEDPTTADLLHQIIERLEQLAWMVSAENRTPQH